MNAEQRFTLEGKRAIVTGGARGIGNGAARGLYECGAEVVLIDKLEKVKEAAKAIDPVRAHAIVQDLHGKEAVHKACKEAVEILGGVDILVNCAGVQFRTVAKDFPVDKWEDVLSVNLSTTFYMCQEAGAYMLEQGSGSIVNIASMLAYFGGHWIPAYAASKGGVAQVTKSLSNEWAPHGVRVNAIAPGYIATDLNTSQRENREEERWILNRVPIGRWGTPEDLQGLIIFLASEASAFITGAVIPIDGGYLAR